MYASSWVLALAVATAAPADNVSWMTDYSAAIEKGSKEGKPVAVIIGTGKAGWNKLSAEGQLTDESLQILKQSYVPVYIDARTEAGKALADAFGVPEGVGIVLSDRTGKLQAFRHEGDLPDSRIAQYLERFADPTLVVQTTVSNPSRRSNYGPGGAAAGYCPTCPTCPNGRCPR